MTIVRIQLVLVCAAAAIACGSSVPNEPVAEFRRAGFYEIKVRLGEMSSLRLLQEEEDELRAAFGDLPPKRECLSAEPLRVGGPFLGDRCRYSRIADRGTVANRSVVCAPDEGMVDTIELTGTTRDDGYNLRILTRRTDASTGELLAEAETFEEARYLGPCPPRLRPA